MKKLFYNISGVVDLPGAVPKKLWVLYTGWVLSSVFSLLCGVSSVVAQVETSFVTSYSALECSVLTQSDRDAVFFQALSTVNRLNKVAVRQANRRAWRPDGSFRGRFFNRAESSLKDIRGILNESAATASECMTGTCVGCVQSETKRRDLLAAFDRLFDLRFPQGLGVLAGLKTSERAKFMRVIDGAF